MCKAPRHHVANQIPGIALAAALKQRAASASRQDGHYAGAL